MNDPGKGEFIGVSKFTYKSFNLPFWQPNNSSTQMNHFIRWCWCKEEHRGSDSAPIGTVKLSEMFPNFQLQKWLEVASF